MSSNELDKLVQEKFGFNEYNFVPVEECGNDSNHSFDVDGKLDKSDKKDLAKWEKGEFVHYSNGTILNALCFHGLIEPGEYIIEVFW